MEVTAMVAIVVANAPALPIRDVNVPAVVLAAFPRLAAIMCPMLTRIAAMVTPVFACVTTVFAPILSLLIPPGFALVLRFALMPPNVSFLMANALMSARPFVPRAGAMALHIMTPRAMPFRVTSITMALSALHMTARTLRVASATA
jgi:hypothetical protein